MKKNNMYKKEGGFTLIELLVVVAIIAILSTIAFLTIQGARERAFDTQIQSELSQVRSNAEFYYYEDGGGSYDDFSTSSGWNRIKEELPGCSASKMMENDSLEHTGSPEEYQIKIADDTASPQYYIAWAPLCARDGMVFCVDSAGNAVEVEESEMVSLINEATGSDLVCVQ